MKIGILATTHKSYAATMPLFLESIKIFPKKLIVSGGHEKRSQNDLILEVTHNSFDFTGLIEIVSNPQLIEDWTHVLTVHDTMELGKNTLELCQLADPTIDATSATPNGMCNLILYKKEYLFSVKDFILELMNKEKIEYVQKEGILFNIAQNKKLFNVPEVVNLGMGTPYSKVERIKECYYALDIIKWKANTTWVKPWVNDA
jgi:hypothetical protein